MRRRLLAGSFKCDAFCGCKIDLLKPIYEVFLSNLSLIACHDVLAYALLLLMAETSMNEFIKCNLFIKEID
jgi:hypothetical protein